MRDHRVCTLCEITGHGRLLCGITGYVIDIALYNVSPRFRYSSRYFPIQQSDIPPAVVATNSLHSINFDLNNN